MPGRAINNVVEQIHILLSTTSSPWILTPRLSFQHAWHRLTNKTSELIAQSRLWSVNLGRYNSIEVNNQHFYTSIELFYSNLASISPQHIDIPYIISKLSTN